MTISAYTPLSNKEEEDHTTSPDDISSASNLATADSKTVRKGDIQITILDAMNQKFELDVNSSDTLLEMRQKGGRVHKIPPERQRLIFMGRLLSEAMNGETLKSIGIQTGMTVHLFPKPRVVSTSKDQAVGDEAENDGNRNGGEDSAGAGAHVPTIRFNRDESNSSGSIVQTIEIFESAQKIKMLAFILLLVSVMELLTLFTIAIGSGGRGYDENSSNSSDPGLDGDSYIDDTSYYGVNLDPGDPTDYAITNDSHYNTDSTREWRTLDYFDLALSCSGLYVSWLGIKASRENTSACAKQFYWCVLVLGIMWITYTYFANIQNEQRREQEEHDHDADIGDDDPDNGFGTLLFLGLIWLSCFYRAWDHHNLLREAEEELLISSEVLYEGDRSEESELGEEREIV